MIKKLGILFLIIGCLCIIAGTFMTVTGMMSDSGSISGGLFLLILGFINIFSSKFMERIASR